MNQKIKEKNYHSVHIFVWDYHTLFSVSRNFVSIESIFLDLLTVVESCQSTPEDKIGPSEILTIHISCVKYVLSHCE